MIAPVPVHCFSITFIYLDNIIVIGRTFENMIRNLDEVLQKLVEAGLKPKPRKCQLFAKQVDFLGHVISSQGIQTDPKKTQVVKEWPKPESLHEVRLFLSFCGYYRRFIPKLAEVAKPLHKLNQNYIWTKESSVAFKALKNRMISSPILTHPDRCCLTRVVPRLRKRLLGGESNVMVCSHGYK